MALVDPRDLERVNAYRHFVKENFGMSLFVPMARKKSWERFRAASPWKSSHDDQGAVLPREFESIPCSVDVNA